MAFWGKKDNKTEAQPTTVSKIFNGWFGTEKDKPPIYAEAIKQAEAIKKSIQISLDSVHAVDSAGHAMDDQLVQAKYVNSSMGFIPFIQLDWYASQGFIGWQNCAVMSQNWLVDKACTMPAKDAIRHGWEIEFNNGEEVEPKIFDEMRKMDKRYQIKNNCIQFIKQGKIFGVRHALFIVDGIDYELPFNPDGVTPGSYKGITQIDPYWIAPELDRSAAANPAAKDFYDPTWWRVNGKRVHKSHFVIMRNGDEVPDLLKPSYFYGGIPTPQKIYSRVYAAERTANEAPLLAMSKRLITLKVDTTKAIADFPAFQQEIEQWVALTNNFGVKVIGGDEEVAQYDTSLGGLDETIMTQYQLVAAAANVPATKLLGTTPKGFNATGEYEEASYHEELESIQENELTPLINRHNLLVMRSHIAPKFGIKPMNVEIKWLPVDSPTAEEQAETNLKKAQTDAALVAAGVIDGFDVRQRLIKDRDSGYTGISDIVPGGPGDREAEQEQNQMLLDGMNDGEDPNEA